MANAGVVVALTPLSTADGLDAEQSVVSHVLQAELSQSTNISLVDRDQMRAALTELKLSQAGIINPDSARQLGSIVGARYFCSGNVSKSGNKVIVLAKVIEVETTLAKLTYRFITTSDDAAEAGKSLAGQIQAMVAQFEAERNAQDRKRTEIAVAQSTKPIPSTWKRPAVMVIIRETHLQQPVSIDPAAETEMIKRLLNDGVVVIDSEYVSVMRTNSERAKLFNSLKTSTQYAAEKKADILIYGEAVSEKVAGLGDFAGSRGRVEIKAINVKTDEILLTDSAESGATDLSEFVAGKKALQNAANRLANAFNYSLLEKWNQAK